MYCPGCEQLIPTWLAALPILPIVYIIVRSWFRRLKHRIKEGKKDDEQEE